MWQVITTSGIYRVKVNEQNNPTYLKSGVYRLEVLSKAKYSRVASSHAVNVNFRSSRTLSGHTANAKTWQEMCGTYESIRMLGVFEQQARVICTRVEDSELDAISNSLFGIDSFSKLTEAQQIEACRAGVRA
jgi:hypothetical protein